MHRQHLACLAGLRTGTQVVMRSQDYQCFAVLKAGVPSS